MKRYFAELSYLGTRYNGWQRQPKSPSVQEDIEKAISTILRKKTDIIGCGRTDTGVHAKKYFLHFDQEGELPEAFLNRLNKFLSPDIAFHKVIAVADGAHARFDAYYRAYEYHIEFNKNPFTQNTALFYPMARQLDLNRLSQVAALLKDYQEFFPFCKSNSDVKTMVCELHRAEWIIDEEKEKLVFHIAANRFLRGMVRLIVGMCLNVSLGKLKMEEVKMAMDTQIRLSKSYSVPPQGLFLTDIRYPFEI